MPTQNGEASGLDPEVLHTIEPGLYTEEAGYRHSDTVAITEGGLDFLTYYPRDLESNVIEA